MEPHVLLLRIGSHGRGHHFGSDCRTGRYVDGPRRQSLRKQGAGCGSATRLTSSEWSGTGSAPRDGFSCGI